MGRTAGMVEVGVVVMVEPMLAAARGGGVLDHP
jgi:hypothetical protein